MADIIARAMAAQAKATAVGTTNGETVDARTGADAVARATLGDLVREVHQKALDNEAYVKNPVASVTATLQHGLQATTVSQASPLNPTIYGRTLVNLLGKDGNFETDTNADGVADGWTFVGYGSTATRDSSTAKYGTKAQRITSSAGDTNTTRRVEKTNVNVEVGKNYLLATDVTTDGVAIVNIYAAGNTATMPAVTSANSTLGKTHYVKFSPTGSGTIFIQLINKVALGTVSWASFDGARLYEIDAATYAKIDVDPEYTGDKLAEKFPYVDSVKHLNGVAITKQGKNLLGPTPDSIHANAVLTAPYNLTLNATANFQVSPYTVDCLPNQQYTFSFGGTGSCYVLTLDATGAQISVKVGLGPGVVAGTYTFTTETTAKFIKVELQNASRGAGTYTFTNPQLELGSTATAFEPQNNDYLYADVTLASSLDGTVRDELVRVNGEWRKLKRWVTDVVLDGALTWALDTDKAGYKIAKLPEFTSAVSSSFTSSNSSVVKYDGKIIPAYAGGAVGADGYRQINTDIFFFLTLSDTDTGFGETYTPLAAEISAYFNGWKANAVDGTGKPTSWVSIVDGTTAPTTNTLAYVSANKAPNYTPYKLSYQLAVTTEEVVTVEGAINLHSGGNQIEVSEGVIVREKIIPQINVSNYHLNYNTVPASFLKNRAASIINVYKNGVLDKAWTIVRNDAVNSNGTSRASIPTADYDAAAEYTVTYTLLDKYAATTNAVDVTAEYNTTTKSILDHVVKRLGDDETAITVNVRAIAELYKRMKALGG